jgi:hypothetical protein
LIPMVDCYSPERLLVEKCAPHLVLSAGLWRGSYKTKAEADEYRGASS